MCEFVSWIELDGEIFFLDNAKLNTKAGRALVREVPRNDLCGHGAIRRYYLELKDRGTNRECTDFASPKNFPKAIVKAIKDGRFSMLAVGRGLLTPKAWERYEKIKGPALVEYEKIKGQALVEYEKIEGPALVEYQKIEGQALVEYQKIKGPAWVEYEKIEGPALVEYQKIKGQAWVEYEKIKGPALAEYEKIEGQAFWKLFKSPRNRIPAWR